MAATEKGVWGLQDVRDKQLQSEWTYDGGRPLYSCGPNVYGAIGLNNPSPSFKISSPTQVGTELTWSKVSGQNNRSYGIKTDGTLWAWGKNEQGEMGQNNNTQYRSPKQIPGTTWSKVSTSSIQVMAIKTDGTLWAWGSNYGTLGLNQPGVDNQAGRGKSSPAQVGTDQTWAHVECFGNGSTVAVKTDGTLWGWGNNEDGHMGFNNKTKYSSPVQVGSDTSWSSNELHWGTAPGNHVYTIKTDGALWVWGTNSIGALGQNDRTYQSSPVQIPGSYQSVGDSGNSGMAIKTDGSMWAWGNGNNGQLANASDGNPNRRSSPVQVGTDTDWSYMGRGGGNTQCAIKTDGTLYNCGRNESGGLGHNAPSPSKQTTMKQLPGIYTGKPSSEDNSLWIRSL